MSDAVIISIITLLGGTSFGGVVLALLARRKTKAEADSVAVAALERAVEVLERRSVGQEKHLDRMSEKAVAMSIKLDAAEEKIGILERREREFLLYRSEVARYEATVSQRLRDAGLDVPEPPRPPDTRVERTRRHDREESTDE